MKTRFTPYYIELIYDAALKSFWRKTALKKFVRSCSISENFISTWGEDERKRDFLDRLFEKLKTNDKGRKALERMAEFLIDQQSFPDLENWEDSNKKIKEAHDAVSKLRIYHKNQNEEIMSEKEKEKSKKQFLKKQNKVLKSQQNLQKLSEALNSLSQRIGTQKAGYDFQDWFYNLMDFYEVVNRKPYVHQGRQIDGSITISGTTYLVELKFTTEQAGSPDIDTFYKKVTTKADNTMGVMLSMSGYSSVAIQEASGAKTPLLLLDHSHLYFALSGTMGFSDLINRVRRHASQTGEAYLQTMKFTN